jgi:dihydroorotate dehydrogenase (NAD+) catalytic subunit
MTASGTAGYGTEGLPCLRPEWLGAFVTKGLSLEPRVGNPPPRIVETPAGMINAIGLQNIGVESFSREHLPLLRGRSVRVVVNFFGETEEEYARLARRIAEEEGIAALEMNVSCPNVKLGGRSFGRDPEVLHGLVRSVRAETGLPLWVKLTPEGVDIVEAAQAAWEGGCDALTVANTYLGLAVDVHTRRPSLSIGTGGLSGPAIRPLSVYRVWRVARQSPIPVIGVGGVGCARDALEYLIAGASAVQVGSAAFRNPGLYEQVIAGIGEYLRDHGHGRVGDVVGCLDGMPESMA